MRILTIHNRYQQAGGEEVVFEAEGRLLRDMGHDVERLVFENADIHSFKARVITALCLFYNPHSAGRLRKKCLDFRPHIIHVHNFFPLASPAVFFVARQFRIPVVLTLHNYRLICPGATLFYNHQIYEKSIRSIFPLHAIWKGIYRGSRWQTAGVALCFAFHNLAGTWNNKVNRFIVLSDFARGKFAMSALKAKADRFSVKPNFAYDCGVGDGHREKHFLYAGRLSKEKGIDILLSAASQFHFKLIIVGDGPLRESVLEASRANVNIDYRGFVPKTTLIAYLKSCTALIVPSVCYEGSPVAILEAFSTGTPVIASRTGSIVEMVEENVSGLLFNPGDSRDLHRKAIMLESDELKCAKLGKNARETYLRKYTPEMNYNMLMEIYNKAIDETNPVRKRSAIPLEADLGDLHIRSKEAPLPRMTIGIPTRNGGARIQRALNSIFDQNYKNLEVIISDNGSTDDTQLVCARNISAHSEIKYYRQDKNIGLVANFDFVLSRASGKYFMWLSDDDVLEPGILHRCVSFLEKNPEFIMVSGQIIYREGEHLDYVEQGFNFTSRSPVLRLIQYYYKAIYGGMFHGVMRTDVAARIPARKVFGNDLHFVASLAYLGKIRNFHFPGYHKSLGGCSRNVHQCARAMGESPLASRFPHFKIAVDAFAEVMYRSPLFALPLAERFFVAVLCFLAKFTGYYGRIAPLMIAGTIKRLVFSFFKIGVEGSYFKRATIVQHNMNIIKES